MLPAQIIISQVSGVLVAIAAVVSMQLKNIKGVLACQLICNALGALSYILCGGTSGFGIYLVALMQSLLYFIFSLINKKAPSFLAIVFVVLYIVCAVSSYKAPIDILSGIAALTCAFALVQRNPFIYRILMVGNGLFWTVYDIGICNYAMLICHVLVLLSAVLGIIRIDLRKKQSK